MGWNTQPPRHVRLDKANPLARRQCVLAWSAASPANSYDGQHATYAGSPGYTVMSGIGRARTFPAASASVRWKNRVVATTGRSITLCAVIRPTNITDSDARLMGVSGTTSDDGFSFRYNAGTLGWVKPGVAADQSSVALTAGVPFFIALMYTQDGATNPVSFYARNMRNGAVQTEDRNAPDAWVVTSALHDIFVGDQHAGGSSFLGEAAFAAVFLAPLTYDEVRALSLNPWQLFKQQKLAPRFAAAAAAAARRKLVAALMV